MQMSSGSDVRLLGKKRERSVSNAATRAAFIRRIFRGKGRASVKKHKYEKTLPRDLYKFFSEFSDTSGVPSFEKFAIQKGITLEELTSYRRKTDFDRAYRECCEIRRDYLIDRALTKRFDPSFVKFLLTECEDDASDDALVLKLTVVE